ncbi:MAG TPA: DUF1992 domain-containing protein [Candidatus Binatia bacterium]|nr:DUF1992 domain-containing protein [Candidatus Binatia bacterium]
MPDPRDPRDAQPARRRDAAGRWQVAPSWESLVDRQIREAMEEGQFDGLPHHGKPLPNDDNPYAAEWGLAFHILRNAGYAPPWIEADKEIRDLLARRDGLVARAVVAGPGRSELARKRDRAELERIVADANAAIARLNSEAPRPRQHRTPLNLARELAAYDAAVDGATGGDPRG